MVDELTPKFFGFSIPFLTFVWALFFFTAAELERKTWPVLGKYFED